MAMQTPIARFTELEAVNRILSTVGGEKIAALTSLSFTADAAYTALRDAMRDLMGQSWGFNTEVDVVLTPNVSNEIDLSTSGYTGTYISVIDFEPEDAGNLDVVIKGSKLYDRKDRSYTVFTADTYKATVSYYLQFDDCPEAVKSYVTAMAAKDFQAQMVGNPQMDAILTQKFLYTRGEFYAFESQQFDYTMWDNYDTWKIVNNNGRPSIGGAHWWGSRA